MARASRTIVVAALATSAMASVEARADFSAFVKGCLVMGGVGIGGTTLAASQSKADIKDSQVLVMAGMTSCVIGGFLAIDIVKKAEMEASQELRLKNEKLKYSVYSVMHDLCVMKKTCGPDGIPIPDEERRKITEGAPDEPAVLKSGN